ncbi:MAG: hypothetical protein MZU95_04265 [Desulfomicrobium escambiense]|nr:hypothetical protein [Desulfomicrobium escambiense]
MVIVNYAVKSSKLLIPQFDWAKFTPTVIVYLIQDWFSPVLINILNYPNGYYTYILNSGKYLFLAFFILFPVALCLFGLIKGLKNNGARILAIITISFSLFQIFMTLQGKIALISRYTIILLPIFPAIIAVGLSGNEKFKKLQTGLFSAYIIVSIIFISFFAKGATKLSRSEAMRTPFEILTGI